MPAPVIFVMPRLNGFPYRVARLTNYTDAVILWSERHLSAAEFDVQVATLAAITGYPVVTNV